MNIPLFKTGGWYDPAFSEFIVWAPFRDRVELVLESPVKGIYPMQRHEDGYWKTGFQVPAGALYFFRLDGTTTCPDPCSFSQPEGVHGPSELADRFSYCWQDDGWIGIPLSDMVIYELHTGCFSPTHDLAGILSKLDHLAELGINTIELMPLAQFPGDRNWGYDGVYPSAIQNSYGGIPGFQRLVDAAHGKGLAVIVDVVYNHMGPEGNYLSEFGPYFTDKYKTPWGPALNFDDAWSDGVRNYFLQNVRMWLEDYHVDGLRIDAVHAIRDCSAVPFIRQLKVLASEIERSTGRKKELIAEIDLNDPRYINPPEKGGYNLDGQWIDEFHHALRALLTGECNAYYSDFGEMSHLEKAFRQTYVYDGNYSVHRRKTFGGHADANPYSQFVVFSQNHDHIGNRALGDRLTGNVSFEQLKLAAATVLLSPYVPLLFMGEEYGEKNPFPFFVSFSDPALIEAVRIGRKAEFPGFTDGYELPDPQSEDTFRQAQLSWKVAEEPGATLLHFYKHLIGLRKTRPAMQGRTRDTMIVQPAIGKSLAFERKILNDQLFIWLHFGAEATTVTNTTGRRLTRIFDSAAAEWLGPGTGAVTVSTQAPASGGSASGKVAPEGAASREVAPGDIILLAPHSALVFEPTLHPSL